ncbi:MAG: cytochrome c biogenesis protein CcsA [Acidobacteriota bacterium]
MKALISALNTLLPVLYVITTIFYGIYFFKKESFFEKTLKPLILMAISIHASSIILRTIVFKHFPIASLFELLTFLSLAIVIIYFFIEQKIGEKSTGFFILIVVFLFQTTSSAFISIPPKINPLLKNFHLGIHTGSALIGYSSLIIAALYSLMYLMLFYDIKGKKFGIIYNRLPSLEILDGMNSRASLVGFCFLTISIVSGIIWSTKVINTRWITDLKIIFVFFTWMIFGFSVLTKKYSGWAGKRTALLSFSGFLVLLFSLIIVNLFLTKFHVF